MGEIQGNPSNSLGFSSASLTLVKRTVEVPYLVVSSVAISANRSFLTQGDVHIDY